ncbi:MAG: hypothetical protein LBC44_01965 [Mycoplasmataceae bacterium]|nr:hypothetical protein [Mycoplasmataceae bacterium]
MLPSLLLYFVQAFTWIVPQLVLPLMMKAGYWQIYVWMPIDLIFGWHNFNESPRFFQVVYTIFDLTSIIMPSVVFLVMGKKTFFRCICIASIIYVFSMFFWILFPSYDYLLDSTWHGQEINPATYPYISQGWGCFPSFHNICVIVFLLAFIFNQNKLHNTYLNKNNFFFIAFSVFLLFCYGMIKYFTIGAFYYRWTEIIFTIVFLCSFIAMSPLWYQNNLHKNREQRNEITTPINEGKNCFLYIKFTCILVFTALWILIYLSTIFTRNHFVSDGLFSLAVCLFFYIVCTLIFTYAKDFSLAYRDFFVKIVYKFGGKRYFPLIRINIIVCLIIAVCVHLYMQYSFLFTRY